MDMVKRMKADNDHEHTMESFEEWVVGTFTESCTANCAMPITYILSVIFKLANLATSSCWNPRILPSHRSFESFQQMPCIVAFPPTTPKMSFAL